MFRAVFILSLALAAEVAQLVEQRTENPRVGSSILPLGTIFEIGLGPYPPLFLKVMGS